MYIKLNDNIKSSEYYNAMTKYPPDVPVFIVSTGRCGTTTLTQILQVHPDVCCLNEAPPRLRTEAFMSWSKFYPVNHIKERVRFKREKLITQIINNRLVYIEGTPPASHLINILYDLFNAKFIHLYCDGREFIRRAADKEWHKKSNPIESLFTMIRRKFLLGIMGARKVDRRLIPPRELNTQIEKLAWLWVEVNNIIINRMSQLPTSHYFPLKLEDLGKNMLVKLHEYIGIKIYPDVLTEMSEIQKRLVNSSVPVFPEFKKWTEQEKRRFEKIAGHMMRKLGYDLNIEEVK